MTEDGRGYDAKYFNFTREVDEVEALKVARMIPCSLTRLTLALMLHIRNDHAKNGELVDCIFESCDKRYNNAKPLKKHFQLKHMKLRLMNLEGCTKD